MKWTALVDHRRLRSARRMGRCYVEDVFLDLSDRATLQLDPIPRYYRCSANPTHPQPGDVQMTHIAYEIVEHDGGWAYRVDGVVSETSPSHEAARRAAAQQRVPGNTTAISYEDKDGRWHRELSDGRDRPITEVKD
jgi:hypothetical protein